METKICDIIGKNGNLVALKNEDVLINDFTIVEVPVAISEMVKCKSHLQINNVPIDDMNLTMDSVRYNAFDELFDRATKLRGASNQRYVTGLRIHLGIKNEKIVLLFQPTCMIKSVNNSEPNRYYTFDGLYYMYDDTDTQEKFIPATEDELVYIANYQDKIRLKHYGKDIFERLNPNEDTTSLVVPFQVIYSLIYDNEYNTDVFLFNAIHEDGNKLNHTVLMGTGRDSQKEFFSGYVGKYANRSHLCPPCNYVEDLVIARPGPTTCP